ncbi:MAG: PiT family inorganic phosphate transporter [Candidatus Tokpelaia hoelldobleri]|uniref:PiT family inorganic phosphate transporter n=1 Tax=Candidatus Tokpelaia hoelldobleri TaxID=1902579 RepID=A0A1U9JTC9_9HYPH|nr:MAG: PiT family inorganic phosphate transporter [Candidatus Tokpelaia hoelldoblerii]
MPGKAITPQTVIDFWHKAGTERWFRKDDTFDAEIRHSFLSLWQKAAADGLRDWRMNDAGLLALILVLDQFPRNMFREDPRAFSTDSLARETAHLVLQQQADTRTDKQLRGFLYLPFEHSEDMADQQLSLRLFHQLGDAEMLRFAEIHADIIRRFGRFPHRNAVLDRQTTREEQKFLDEGGFAG